MEAPRESVNNTGSFEIKVEGNVLEIIPIEALKTLQNLIAQNQANIQKFNQKFKILALDFDNTLVVQKSHEKFPTNEKDWRVAYPNVVEVLEKYHKEGWTLVIFSNQGGVEKKKVTLEVAQTRIFNFIKFTNLPIYAFAALGYDNNRKPHIGMWYSMLHRMKCNLEIIEIIEIAKLLTKSSLFVGDAAGRLVGNSVKKDFSCSDRKFAHNIGIDFKTPEEFFLNQKNERKWEWNCFNPFEFMTKFNEDIKTNTNSNKTNKLPKQELLPNPNKEIIILVGAPATSKSTLCKLLPTYIRVNQDTLGTKAKCIKLATSTMAKGQNLIIDNTNSDSATRKLYVDIARKHNYHIKIADIKVDKEMAEHLDEMRVEITNSKPIPTIVYSIFYKNYRNNPPTLAECDELIEWRWEPNVNDPNFKAFLMFY